MNKVAISLSSLTLVASILIVSASYSLQGIFTSKISAYAVPKQQQQQYQLNNTTTTTTTNTMTNKPSMGDILVYVALICVASMIDY